MKYIKFACKALFKLFTKVYPYIPLLILAIGLYNYGFSITYKWFIPFIIWVHLGIAYALRGYSTHIVFNYVLQNNIWLPRLLERKYVLGEDGIYRPTVIKNGVLMKGYIVKRDVSYVLYQFVLWVLWIWVDNDSGRDTASQAFTGKLANGEVWKWLPKFLRNIAKKEYEYMLSTPLHYGNVWNLGDARKDNCPEWHFMGSLYWLIRNTAYNFNYMFEECAKDSKDYFYIQFPKLGWHFGYIPYTNSERQGRMVWFSEDYDKLDSEKLKNK